MTRTSKKVEKAYLEVQDLYKDLRDENGSLVFDYIDNVYSFCRSENEKLVALLSAVLPRSLMTEREVLYAYGSTVCDALKVLVSSETESEDEFLLRVKNNPISRAVKLAEFKFYVQSNKMSSEEFDRCLNILIS